MKAKRIALELPRVDGLPRRPYTSVNVRHEEKRAFDLLHSYWRLAQGEQMSQVDAFSRLFALALDHPEANAPPDLVRALRRR